MRKIFTYEGKLVEEIGYTKGEKVVYFKYLKHEDMSRCCKCGEPINKEMSIVEGCKLWDEKCEPIDTIIRRVN